MNKEKLLEYLECTYELSKREAEAYAKEGKPLLEGLKLGEVGLSGDIMRLIELGEFEKKSSFNLKKRETMDTYVVIGEDEILGETRRYIAYAGNDKETALNIDNLIKVYHFIKLEVWRKGSRIEEHKFINGEWTETFNYIKTLEEDIGTHQKKIDILADALNKIKN